MTIKSSDEAELLARLQSQFGDMNVNVFLNGCPNNDTTEDDDSESSIEEPTPEELQAWQEAQFARGEMRLQTKEILDDAATARRRRLRSEKEEDKDWERVPAAPELDGTSIFFPSNADGMDLAAGVHPLLQKLVNFDPEVLGTHWRCLYSSSGGDGVSFRNLIDKIRAYSGSTMLLFGGVPSATRCLGDTNNSKQVSLGFFTFDTWTESEDMFGSDDECFLFALDYESNDVKVFPSRLRGNAAKKGTKKYMYCNPSSGAARSGKTDGSCHGVGFGGTPSRPRLHITESLEECRALSYDALFEDGDLMLGKGSESLNYFDVNEIEVWAVGGDFDEQLAAQAKQKEIELATLEHARQVDKRQLLEHIENGFAWKSYNKPGLFGHRDSR
mmetsp:Transcript_9121/g.13748  ORF Transcript_9121/g.13748 Transcript_9121/m.13748 type:complete len:386 (-) Transcript_9121:343-1500(-)